MVGNVTSSNLDNTPVYIAGYVQGKVSKKLQCINCFQFLSGDLTPRVTCALIGRLDRGKLVKPYEDVVVHVELVDWVVEFEAKWGDIFAKKNVHERLKILSTRLIIERKPLIISDLCTDPSHKMLVLRSIISLYLNVKLGHMCRQRNLNKNTLTRHIHKKLPIFNHE